MSAATKAPPTPPPDVAGVTLAIPEVRYEITDRPWGSAVLAREHPARSLEAATLTVRLTEGDVVATFPMKSFIQPPMHPYGGPPPAEAWRGLVVEQGLLSRPDLVWIGAFPAGWGAGLSVPWAKALGDELKALHRRYTSLTQHPTSEYALRSLECAECLAARAAAQPPPGVRVSSYTPSAAWRPCTHLQHALRAVGELCTTYPELTFELLAWIEPAGARVAAEGPPPSRFVFTAPMIDALLGRWLVGDDVRSQYRSWGYESRRTYRPDWSRPSADPRRPPLPRQQDAAVGLAASAWGVSGRPEVLVSGNAAAAMPTLDLAAAPPPEAQPVFPGDPAKGKAAARARRAKAKRRAESENK